MKILWLDINSSYSHSSMAFPAIHAQIMDKAQWQWSVVRGTINDNPGTIAAAVEKEQPDIIAATFWLFTHKMQIEVLSRCATLLDKVLIVCGGPEFLGENEEFLRRNTFVSAIIRGEGERAFPKLLENIRNPELWDTIEGLCWISEGDNIYHDNGNAKVEDFSKLRYPEESPFFNWDKPFVQMESTRGCFNTCAFCVSGADKPIRYQSLEQIRMRLENISEHGIKDVRILDRTFNYDPLRAVQMLDIFESYASKMRFHLEIHPSLLSEKLKEKIAAVPKGLLHLEAGIQSLDKHVLDESGRKGSLETSLQGLEFLCSLQNIEVHADLIVGLPAYTLERLRSDIIRLIALGANELQVESLKVLPGTRMCKAAIDKGLKYSPLPPYEILKTPAISPTQIAEAMHISRMIDMYYNAPCWQKVIRELILSYDDYLTQFTQYLKDIMVIDSPMSLERRGIILYEYCKQYIPEKVPDITVAWIEAGFSLKKAPAGNTRKIKSPEIFIEENNYSAEIIYGSQEPSHRYYLFTSPEQNIIFGYDSESYRPTPSFRCNLYKKRVTIL